MASDWLTVKELAPETAPQGPRGHTFENVAKKWPAYCTSCGLVNLKNGISRLAASIGCHYKQDARYKQWLRSGRKPL